MEQKLLVVLVALVILTLLFILGRELVCWYWKINESLGVLKEIRDLLVLQQKKPTRQSSQAAQARAEREAIAVERASLSADEIELERQALSAPNPDRD